MPVESVFNAYAKFFIKISVELSDYLSGVSEKWSEINLLIGACNDISKIKQFFQT